MTINIIEKHIVCKSCILCISKVAVTGKNAFEEVKVTVHRKHRLVNTFGALDSVFNCKLISVFSNDILPLDENVLC